MTPAIENLFAEEQPSERVQKALYTAILNAATYPDLEDADRLWIREHALELIADFAETGADAAISPQPVAQALP